MDTVHQDAVELFSGTAPLRLLYISTSRHEGDWLSTSHAHPHTELFYIMSGQGQFRAGENLFSVSAGDLVAVPPGVQHTETAAHTSTLEYIVLGVEGGEVLFENHPVPRQMVIPCLAAHSEVLAYLRAMLQELETRNPHYGLVVGRFLEILFIKLQRLLPLSPPEPAGKRANRECAIIKQYIDQHYKENLTLDELATIAHLSKYYLVHAFTKEYGISPINYLIRRRIEEGRRYLQHTDHSIAEIAQVLGFSSPSYFSQCFSRVDSVSPREYRRRSRALADMGKLCATPRAARNAHKAESKRIAE